jgi:hypothetical protein
LLSVHAARNRPAQPALEPPADPAAARLVALLLHNGSGGLTIAAMQERGIEVPAQAIYALRLAGYEIERAPIWPPDGHKLVGYRLRARLSPLSEETAHEVGDDAL